MRNGLIFVLILISTISLFHFYSDSFYSLNLLEQKKINKILILNNRYFSDKYFISKLSIFEGESFYKFNPYTLKKELDKIQEIKSYKFEINLNGELSIIIYEKKPFMLWHKGNKDIFVDDEGNTLNYDYHRDDKELVDLYGENADKYIFALKDYLDVNILKKLKIQKITFNQDLGWKLHISKSKCFYLPIKKLDKMMDIFENIIVSDLFQKYNIFDFRILGRVYMSKNKC
ncbi:MAG: cell division protein FtsQ/DivIB [Alphaproteobacteria bacterium]